MKQKQILFLIAWYASLVIMAMGFYLLLLNFLDREISNLTMWIFVAIFAFFSILIVGKSKWNFNTFEPIPIKYIGIILFVLLLFVANNFLLKKCFLVNFEITNFKFELLALLVSSCGEEFLYRGFIQNYIDYYIPNQKVTYTKGILISTILMTITHLGFFSIMPIIPAFLSLILVVIFFLLVGIIMQNTKNLVLVCVIHILVNWVHLFIQNFS